MIITYHSKQFFKIQQGDLVVALNPIGKDSKSADKVSRFGASLVLSTLNHPDYNGVETVTYGDTKPFAVTGPGDYEVKGIFIKGIPSESVIGGKKYINTIYTFSIDEISICFLGGLSNATLSDPAREAIDSADILFVPVGNGDFLTPADAYKLAVSLEPRLIIPMEYEASSLKTFLKEGGEEGVKPIEKLVIKRKDLEGKEGEIVVLSA